MGTSQAIQFGFISGPTNCVIVRATVNLELLSTSGLLTLAESQLTTRIAKTCVEMRKRAGTFYNPTYRYQNKSSPSDF